MTDFRWKIIEMERANIELSSIGQRLAEGEGQDNYSCGNCDYLLAKSMPLNMGVKLGFESVRCPRCKKVNAIEWSDLLQP
jgi:phage FluMu protein Com